MQPKQDMLMKWFEEKKKKEETESELGEGLK